MAFLRDRDKAGIDAARMDAHEARLEAAEARREVRRTEPSARSVGSIIFALLLIGGLVAVGWYFYVKRGRSPSADLKSAGTAFNQATLTGKVKTKFGLDTRVSQIAINVDSDHDVVTLRGVVPNEATRRTAEEMARTVPGVADVRNQLTLDPNIQARQANIDTRIRADVMTKLAATPLNKYGLQANVQDGIVQLRGTVSTPEELASAEQTARSVADVKNVDVSGLKVGTTQ